MTPDTNTAAALSNAARGEYLTREKPFKGRYQTELFERDGEKRLLIPHAYEQLLQFGGVITVGNDEHLLLFSAAHWQHVITNLAAQYGTTFAGSDAAIIRNIYGRHVEFEALNDEGNGAKSVSLNDDLCRYAKLDGKVVMVGLVYYAEIHREEQYYDSLLDAEDMRKLASALNL